MLKQLLGLHFITLAWVDPFTLGQEFQIIFFVLGMDMTSLLLKIGIFGLDMIFGVSEIGWRMVIFILVDFLLGLLKLKKLVGFVIKPLVLAGIIYFSGLGWELGVIVGGIDLLLNFSKRHK